jgi:hypothetical protein
VKNINHQKKTRWLGKQLDFFAAWMKTKNPKHSIRFLARQAIHSVLAEDVQRIPDTLHVLSVFFSTATTGIWLYLRKTQICKQPYSQHGRVFSIDAIGI